ncbi:MAG: thioredoxin-disulfide reductase [Thermoplasmata archaeon]|nr:MAG: thioredoxin-disulfide reductase [Thermoplasmata archaeon]
MSVYDVAVLGGGPAGVSAAIYTFRGGLKTIVIAPEIGGQPKLTGYIENVAGIKKIFGEDFARVLREQLVDLGVELLEGESVEEVYEDDGIFRVITDFGSEIEARSLIIATGRRERKLGVPGEDRLQGRGVSYCAVCDAAFYRGMDVAIVGGGNTAVSEAIYTAGVVRKIYLIHRRDQFRAEWYIVNQLKSLPNVELVLDSVVEEIIGEKSVEAVRVRNLKTGETREIPVKAVFILIGEIPNTEPFREFVEMDDQGYIIVDEYMHTSRPGVFAAGDVTNFRYKQIAVAIGQGATAGLSAFEYLKMGGRKMKQ